MFFYICNKIISEYNKIKKGVRYAKKNFEEEMKNLKKIAKDIGKKSDEKVKKLIKKGENFKIGDVFFEFIE